MLWKKFGRREVESSSGKRGDANSAKATFVQPKMGAKGAIGGRLCRGRWEKRRRRLHSSGGLGYVASQSAPAKSDGGVGGEVGRPGPPGQEGYKMTSR